MQKTLLLLILLLSLISCIDKKNHHTGQTDPEKQEGIPSGSVQKKEALTGLEEEEIIRNKVNQWYLEELKKCSQDIDMVTDFNGKKEFWEICDTDLNNRIISIYSYKDSTLFSELYFVKDGQFIYAEESEQYMPLNNYPRQSWTCQFYINQGELVSLMSLGHGKTEDDTWNPEIILEMYSNRLEELNQIKGHSTP